MSEPDPRLAELANEAFQIARGEKERLDEEAHTSRNGGKKKSESQAGKLSAVTAALNAETDPVVKVAQYGRTRDAALVIQLRSGAELAFQPQTDLLKFQKVREQAMLAGLPLGNLTTKTWTAVTVDRVREAAEILDDASRLDELITQSCTFLLRVLGVQVHPFINSDPESRYEAFWVMQNHDVPRDGFTPAHARSIALLDTETGTRWLRLTDFREWWREQDGKASWAQACSIAREVGWRVPGELKVRRPKAIDVGPTFHRVNPLLIAAGWEDAE